MPDKFFVKPQEFESNEEIRVRFERLNKEFITERKLSQSRHNAIMSRLDAMDAINVRTVRTVLN